MLIPCVHVRANELIALYSKSYGVDIDRRFVELYLQAEHALTITEKEIDAVKIARCMHVKTDVGRLFALDTKWIQNALEHEQPLKKKLCASCYRLFVSANPNKSNKRTHPLAKVAKPHV
jgi:hypothetical protein